MSEPRILYTVLNWGLGHASRSVPVIRALLKRGCEVIIASDGGALRLLKEALPAQKYFDLPAYDVRYPARNIVSNGILNARKVTSAIKAEKEVTRDMVARENIDAVITDNRYGCHVDTVPSVIITHHISLQSGNPVFNRLSDRKVRKWLAPFDEIWIPDTEDRKLSGKLSGSTDDRVRYIGWLSSIVPLRRTQKYDIAVILSGPEPQRTHFERTLVGHLQLVSREKKIAVIRGLGEPEDKLLINFAEITDFMGRFELADLLNSSGMVVCRSGYSSLMDLMVAGKKALLVPTPGQPEQEYLARTAGQLPQFISQRQKRFDLKAAIQELANIDEPAPADANEGLLTHQVDQLLVRL